MTTTNNDSKLDYLRLIRSENVGPITFYLLLKYFGSAKEALANINDFAKRGGKTKPIKLYPESEAQKEMDEVLALGAEIIAFNEDDYPYLLKQIPDTPPLLTVLGHKHLLHKEAVAIVGTRDASLNGRNMAKKLGEELASHGYTVISGMALGIDAAAHEGALAATDSAGTIAVLGTGIDVVYPPQNQPLYDRIRKAGLIISEFPLKTKANPVNFPRRNRLISGLSKGIVVVEARIKSGSLITAHMALEQNREVMAIPGSPLDPRCGGTNHLIKQGATLIEVPSDVIKTLENLPSMQEDIFSDDYAYEDFTPEAFSEDELDNARKSVLSLLGNGAVAIDDLIRQSGATASLVSIVLVELELAGRIERLAGNHVNLLLEWQD